MTTIRQGDVPMVATLITQKSTFYEMRHVYLVHCRLWSLDPNVAEKVPIAQWPILAKDIDEALVIAKEYSRRKDKDGFDEIIKIELIAENVIEHKR